MRRREVERNLLYRYYSPIKLEQEEYFRSRKERRRKTKKLPSDINFKKQKPSRNIKSIQSELAKNTK